MITVQGVDHLVPGPPADDEAELPEHPQLVRDR